MYSIEIGVHDFISKTLRTGGISAEFTPKARAAAGTAAHETATERRPEGYLREVPIRHVYEDGEFSLAVRGRIDGLYRSDGTIYIEEIKSTYLPLEDIDPLKNPLHMAQLQLYHHFISAKNPGDTVKAVLTYINLLNLEERSFEMTWTYEESAALFTKLAAILFAIESEGIRWRSLRDSSLASLCFPYDSPRPGQVTLLDSVSSAISAGKDILIEAATGIGKTIGVLYPSIVGLRENKGYSRIFFLTAKSAGVDIVRRTISILRDQGIHLRVVYLQAKDRICPFKTDSRPECGEGYCTYADGFYDRVSEAVRELLDAEEMTPELISEKAHKANLCPFELSLELALYADLIVCDYNYAYDPAVYLRRFFAPGLPSDNLFVVDEAHNLVHRGRDMYSAALLESTLEELWLEMKFESEEFCFCCLELLKQLNAWGQSMAVEGTGHLDLPSIPKDFLSYLDGVIDLLSDTLTNTPRDDRRQTLLDGYYELSAFSRVAANLTVEYSIYAENKNGKTNISLFCVNPGPALKLRNEKSVSAVFFSATLSPSRYFKELLGTRDGAKSVMIPSPFPVENRLYLHVPDVSTKYSKREGTKPTVARVITDVVAQRRGNYLVFFPSYAYLGNVWAEIMMSKPKDIVIHVQKAGMGISEQTAFLGKVTADDKDHSNLGMAVMGGLFGEGVDLPGDQLIGTVIVGPGLPGLSKEQELIRRYYDDRNGQGYLYSYVIPGIIKVIQAAGRVFRTPDDKGVVILLDDRFLEEQYKELLPDDWGADSEDFSTEQYRERVSHFWMT